VRNSIMPNEFDNISEFILAAIRAYRKYRWEDQDPVDGKVHQITHSRK